ncbi:MAG TPA: RIP metalloprotease RseP [Mariprofundaceae bacterium]|nr:RIP metalloprotease RseP [Mariprofundaceae bacterium]
MIEVLHTTLAFVVAIALLVAVHEFGHFLVARKLGIKVEKFSIGFGPALFSWRSRDGEVLYVIAAIPLGGYVKMFGENPDEEGGEARTTLSEAERARAFDVQPVWKRAAVAVAGPGFNFLFAIVAYAMVGWIGQNVIPPVIGNVAPASLAERAGMESGDRILKVDGSAMHSWSQIEEALKGVTGRDANFDLLREGNEFQVTVHVPTPAKDPWLINVADDLLGMSPGLKIVIAKVVPGSPAEKSGIRSGDVIRLLNGRTYSDVGQLIEEIRAQGAQMLNVGIDRDGTLLDIRVQPEADAQGNVRIGVMLAAQAMLGEEVYRMGPLTGAFYGFERTWEMTALTVQVVGKMLTAAISPDNLGGPIAIAQMAGKTAELGLVSFLTFLALISVNLAVLNLFPVPVLDGGHLLYLGLEKLRGRPLSPKVMGFTQIVGVALIVALMVFAFYNDLSRLDWSR